MPNGLKQLAENLLELKEAFSEEELLAGSLHPRAEHVILLLRNLAVGAAAALFLAPLGMQMASTKTLVPSSGTAKSRSGLSAIMVMASPA